MANKTESPISQEILDLITPSIAAVLKMEVPSLQKVKVIIGLLEEVLSIEGVRNLTKRDKKDYREDDVSFVAAGKTTKDEIRTVVEGAEKEWTLSKDVLFLGHGMEYWLKMQIESGKLKISGKKNRF